jgi:hypothetical protein
MHLRSKPLDTKECSMVLQAIEPARSYKINFTVTFRLQGNLQVTEQRYRADLSKHRGPKTMDKTYLQS